RGGWTYRTADGSVSARYEHTIVITWGEPVLLTAARLPHDYSAVDESCATSASAQRARGRGPVRRKPSTIRHGRRCGIRSSAAARLISSNPSPFAARDLRGRPCPHRPGTPRAGRARWLFDS